MFNILSFLILGTGCQTQVTQIETLLPAISISNREVNFGEVDWGDTVYRTITVTNQGELPMGIHPIAIEGEGFENNFALIYYPETIVCEDPTVLEVREAEDWDPNLEPGDFLLISRLQNELISATVHPQLVMPMPHSTLNRSLKNQMRKAMIQIQPFYTEFLS